ncbi:MAG TPA: tetratricopeptide repeat protein [Alphaproteobacteria bacterium]|nr:tetratricopeptide repeat protein [Alphaproteobacteria bacterium]
MEAHDAAATFIYRIWPKIEANKNRIITGAVIVLAAILIILFLSWRHQQNQIDAGDALTESLVSIPPNANPAQFSQSYLAIASDYSGTQSGTRALLQGATALFNQGKYTEAQGYFQRYLDENPDSEFSGIAALGAARCLEAEGKIDEAIGAYQHVAQYSSDEQSVTQATFSQARLSMLQGRYPEAFQDFQTVIQKDPYGALGNEARQYAFELQSKLPRQAPTAPASGFNLSH